METFGKRLLAIYNELPCNKSDFARELGMKNPQGINPYLKEDGSVFGGELLAVFSEKFPQFNILWLISGKGEMYNAGFAPPKKSEASETVEELRAAYDKLQSMYESLHEETVGLQKNMRWIMNQMNVSKQDIASDPNLVEVSKRKTKHGGGRALPEALADYFG